MGDLSPVAHGRTGRAGPAAVPSHSRDLQDPYLGDELVFRGGTCLHKLYETGAARYSEDLDSGTMRLKVEVNTFERAPARPLVHVRHAVTSPWFTGAADVQTFDLAELVATKIRALFQRSKGRDLFDLWLAITQLGVAPQDLATCFGPYRPDGYTARRAELNLREKLSSAAFRNDLVPLVGVWPEGYDVDQAGALILNEVLPLI